MTKTTNSRRKPTFRGATFADAFLARPQRLRADETATASTLRLHYAAKWVQGGGR